MAQAQSSGSIQVDFKPIYLPGGKPLIVNGVLITDAEMLCGCTNCAPLQYKQEHFPLDITFNVTLGDCAPNREEPGHQEHVCDGTYKLSLTRHQVPDGFYGYYISECTSGCQEPSGCFAYLCCESWVNAYLPEDNGPVQAWILVVGLYPSRDYAIYYKFSYEIRDCENGLSYTDPLGNYQLGVAPQGEEFCAECDETVTIYAAE